MNRPAADPTQQAQRPGPATDTQYFDLMMEGLMTSSHVALMTLGSAIEVPE
jgi:hypothetical protein